MLFSRLSVATIRARTEVELEIISVGSSIDPARHRISNTTGNSLLYCKTCYLQNWHQTRRQVACIQGIQAIPSTRSSRSHKHHFPLISGIYNQESLYSPSPFIYPLFLLPSRSPISQHAGRELERFSLHWLLRKHPNEENFKHYKSTPSLVDHHRLSISSAQNSNSLWADLYKTV